jgi:hypothetical protein
MMMVAPAAAAMAANFQFLCERCVFGSGRQENIFGILKSDCPGCTESGIAAAAFELGHSVRSGCKQRETLLNVESRMACVSRSAAQRTQRKMLVPPAAE